MPYKIRSSFPIFCCSVIRYSSFPTLAASSLRRPATHPPRSSFPGRPTVPPSAASDRERAQSPSCGRHRLRPTSRQISASDRGRAPSPSSGLPRAASLLQPGPPPRPPATSTLRPVAYPRLRSPPRSCTPAPPAFSTELPGHASFLQPKKPSGRRKSDISKHRLTEVC